MLLMAESRLFCYELTVGTYRLEIIAEKKDLGVVPVPVLGHSRSSLGVALSGLRRRGEGPACAGTTPLVAASSSGGRLHILDTLESSWAEGEPDRATERVSVVGNISHLATLTGV